MFTTIQAAVDAALDEDTIIIPAGTFTGPGNFNVLIDKDLLIFGAGIGNTIVDPQGQGRGFLYQGPAVTEFSLLEDLTIQNGTAQFGGGISLAGGASPNLRAIEIKNCSADSGGGIFSFAGTVWNASSLFLHDNSATQSGGAIAMTMPRGILRESDINDNTSGIVGGGVSIANVPGFDNQPGVRIEGVAFRRNSATSCGGALYSEFADELRVDRTRFIANSSNDGGGAIELVGDLLVGNELAFVQNSVIAHNTSSSGGGMRVTGGSVIVQNCTIADNDATVHTGGLLVSGQEFLLINTILWGNVSPDVSLLIQQVDFSFVSHGLPFFDDCEGGLLAPFSISEDPLFVNPNENNYHLGVGSPCIDAGFPVSNYFVTQEDIDGQPRVQGNGVDIGADEVVSDARPLGVVAGTGSLSPRYR